MKTKLTLFKKLGLSVSALTISFLASSAFAGDLFGPPKPSNGNLWDDMFRYVFRPSKVPEQVNGEATLKTRLKERSPCQPSGATAHLNQDDIDAFNGTGPYKNPEYRNSWGRKSDKRYSDAVFKSPPYPSAPEDRYVHFHFQSNVLYQQNSTFFLTPNPKFKRGPMKTSTFQGNSYTSAANQLDADAEVIKIDMSGKPDGVYETNVKSVDGTVRHIVYSYTSAKTVKEEDPDTKKVREYKSEAKLDIQAIDGIGTTVNPVGVDPKSKDHYKFAVPYDPKAVSGSVGFQAMPFDRFVKEHYAVDMRKKAPQIRGTIDAMAGTELDSYRNGGMSGSYPVRISSPITESEYSQLEDCERIAPAMTVDESNPSTHK